MNSQTLKEFVISGDTLRVYKNETLLFASKRERLLPLLEYIDRCAVHHEDVIILDRVVGNAAAFLAIKAGCREIHSPLGSQHAIETLEKYGIKYHFDQVVPYIEQANGGNMCPMEKLSLGKDSEEFYTMMKAKR